MKKDLVKESHISKYWIYYLLISVEAFMIVLYNLFVGFSQSGSTKFSKNYNDSAQEAIKIFYPKIEDINVMIFIGFGFILAYFKNHSWSSITICFGIAAWTYQMAFLGSGWWNAVFSRDWLTRIRTNMLNLAEVQSIVVCVLVSLGVVLGRLNFSQYIVMASLVTLSETFILNLNYYVFVANDIGGGMTTFLFGAVFGLSTSVFVKKQDPTNTKYKVSSHSSNIIAMIGTLFLWVYFPSWNSVFASGNSDIRGIINTIIALTGSCVMSFFITPFLSNGKLNIKHILFGSISGGVMLSSIADMVVSPWVSFFLGCLSGGITVYGLHYVIPLMNNTRFQDSCGVVFLFGIPGLLSGIISAIYAGTADPNYYGLDMYNVFILFNNPRSQGGQAGYQLLLIFIVVLVSSIIGAATGILLNYTCFKTVEDLFSDREFFEYINVNIEKKYERPQKIELTNLKVDEKSEVRELNKEDPKQENDDAVKVEEIHLDREKEQEEEVVQAEKEIPVPVHEVKPEEEEYHIKHIEIQISAMD